MKVFVTGGTGFIGGAVVRMLRDRGDEVRVLVRDPERAEPLAELGCELVTGDLSDAASIRSGLEGCEAAIHGAAVYEVGIPKARREPMRQANVVGTETVLRACLEAKTPKVVYISTVAAFGNTRGEVADESYVHPGREFSSYYEETKARAHAIARRMCDERELPCVIVQPGGVYGPNDHSAVGHQMSEFLRGRMPALVFPDVGMNMVHVDDVADGILLALERGEVGEQYVLGAQLTTMRELIETLARVAGRRPPRITIPTAALKAIAPLGPVIGRVIGQPPNMRELIRSADGVTFWASHDKAVAELGYSPRGLEQGLRDTLRAEGRLPAAA